LSQLSERRVRVVKCAETIRAALVSLAFASVPIVIAPRAAAPRPQSSRATRILPEDVLLDLAFIPRDLAQLRGDHPVVGRSASAGSTPRRTLTASRGVSAARGTCWREPGLATAGLFELAVKASIAGPSVCRLSVWHGKLCRSMLRKGNAGPARETVDPLVAKRSLPSLGRVGLSRPASDSSCADLGTRP
jgi:hypothetical protein